MKEIILDMYKGLKSDRFFIIKIIYLLQGLKVGLRYGLRLSIPAIITYLALPLENIARGEKPFLEAIFGIPVVVGIYGAVCSSIFFLLFGNNINDSIRSSFGILGGVVFGFLIALTIAGAGSIGHILYGITFGIIGGLFIAENSTYYCNQVDNLSQGVLNRFKFAFISIIVLILVSKYDFSSKIEDFTKEKQTYIIAISESNKSQAIKEAKKLINLGYRDAKVLLTTNGYYAVSIGDYIHSKAVDFKKQMIKNNVISDSSFLIGDKGIVSNIPLYE